MATAKKTTKTPRISIPETIHVLFCPSCGRDGGQDSAMHSMQWGVVDGVKPGAVIKKELAQHQKDYPQHRPRVLEYIHNRNTAAQRAINRKGLKHGKR